jgi:hypothetical protein
VKTVGFWLSAGERALKTFAQVAVVALGLGEPGASVIGLDWQAGAGMAAAAALASLFTSVASAPAGPKGSPSLVEVPEGTVR